MALLFHKVFSTVNNQFLHHCRQKTSLVDDVFRKVLIRPDDIIMSQLAAIIRPDSGLQEHFLKSLKNVNTLKVSDNVKVVDMGCHPPSESKGPQPCMLYIRDFYDRLFDKMWSCDHSLLLGNPGISKSWFQWYIIYRLVNNKAKERLGCPNVVVRQVGKRFDYFFLQEEKVFRSVTDILDSLSPEKTLYMFDPDSQSVAVDFLDLKTIATCSPNQLYYKYYQKCGAGTFYMPTWQLDELQAVAAHMVANSEDENFRQFLAPEEIEKRYKRFGGIIRYVIPRSKDVYEIACRKQESTLAHCDLSKVYKPHANVEVIEDRKENISHFLLHYDAVKGQPGELDEGEFCNFSMQYASEYIQRIICGKIMSKKVFKKALLDIQTTFLLSSQSQVNSVGFEHLVRSALIGKFLQWKVCRVGKEAEWHDRTFHFDSLQILAHFERFEDMKVGTLYYPADRQFPIVDMLWVENDKQAGCKEVFGVQVTFGTTHAKPKSAYKSLYEKLGLQPKDKVNIYVVTNPLHTHKYLSCHDGQFFKPVVKSGEPLPYQVEYSLTVADGLKLVGHKVEDYPF